MLLVSKDDTDTGLKVDQALLDVSAGLRSYADTIFSGLVWLMELNIMTGLYMALSMEKNQKCLIIDSEAKAILPSILKWVLLFPYPSL